MNRSLVAPPRRRPTDAEVATFWEDGVVCLRGILEPTCLASLREVIEPIRSSTEMADLSEMADSLAGGGGATDEGRGRFISGVDLRYGHPRFDEFCLDGPLGEIVGAILAHRGATEVRLFEDSILIKGAHSEESTRWHTDLGYFQVDGAPVVTSWVPLDHVDARSGALSFVRGSHRWNRDFRPNLFVTDEPIGEDSAEVVPDIDSEAADHEIVSFDLDPGDLTVHHARTIHGAGPNRGEVARRAISLRYIGNDVVVRRREGLPIKEHQESWSDGEPVVDDEHHPVVWRSVPGRKSTPAEG